LENESHEGVVHMQVSTIGLDLAKNVFQVHGVDATGTTVITRQLRRRQVIEFFKKLPSCLIGMEACATAHHWARELAKLGHMVRLMPASYVKAYVKRSKNDAADAAAICEAVTRPSMRLVPVKTIDQQATLTRHRTRDLLIRQRTQLVNAVRAHLAELGLVAARGRDGMRELIAIVTDNTNSNQLPEPTKQALRALVAQLAALQEQIGKLERGIHAEHRSSDRSRRLETIPGIGVIGASAISATVTDPSAFKSGREFAAWIGLVPRQSSTGGQERLGGISKQGDRYLRRLLIVGATTVIRHARTHPSKHPWLMKLLAKKPAKVVAVALANKMARIAWAILTTAEPIGRRRSRPPGKGLGNGRVRRRQRPTTNCEGDDGVMRNGRAVDREKPVPGHWVSKPEKLIGTRSADHIRASGHAPRQQAGHMTCTRPHAVTPDSSCNAGVVHT
jgi:transposase